MSKAKNLELRGSTYYARITTPKTLAQLRHQVGRKGAREIKRSLGTGDRRQAEVLLAGFMAEAHQAFAAEEAELRAAIAAGTPAKRLAKALVKPNADDLERTVLEFKHKELDGHGRYRDAWRDSACTEASTPKSSWSAFLDASDAPVSRPAVKSTATRSSLRAMLFDSEGRAATDREQLLKDLQSDLGKRSYGRVKGHIERLVAARGWELPEDSDQYRLLANP